jgi:hypothetical protein
MVGLPVGDILSHHPFSVGRREAPDVAKRPPDASDGPAAAHDKVALSPRALELAHEGADKDDAEEIADDHRALVKGPLRGLVHKALNTLRRDLKHLLKGFGFASDVANQFAKSFIEPVVSAIKEGLSFSANLSIAAYSQTTQVSGSTISQSSSLFAEAIAIEVNQNTGEVSVSLMRLSVQEDIDIAVGDRARPLVSFGPGPVEPPAAADEADDDSPLHSLLRDVQERLAFQAVSLETMIAVRWVEFFDNDHGDPITRIVVDAEAPLASLGDGDGDDEKTPLQEPAADRSV